MNYYEMLTTETQQVLKKNKVSGGCFNMIVYGIMEENKNKKFSELPNYIRVYEPMKRTHTKYEFYKFVECEPEKDIDKIITNAWIELKKAVAQEEKNNKIAEEFGNMVSFDNLTNELRGMNLYAFHETNKYGTLKFYLPFSKDKPTAGCSTYYVFVDNKQYFTVEEKEEIINQLKAAALHRIDDIKNEYEQTKKFYNL